MAGKFEPFEVAGRAWPVLAKLSRSRETITYGDLAKKLNVHHRSCRFFLGLIQYHWRDNRIPPLQSLVANKRMEGL